MNHKSPAPVREEELRRGEDTVEAQLAAEGPALMALAVLKTGLAMTDPSLIDAVGVALARSCANQAPPDRLAVYQQTMLALDSLTSNNPHGISAHLEGCLGTESQNVRAVLEVISRLGLHERQTLFLCDVVGWPREDVAALLDLSQAEVRRHLARGRSRVRVACLGEVVLPCET